MPNVCLLSTFSGKERERQRVGNDHRPSLAACCGRKKKIHSGSKEKNFCVRCNGISGDVTRRSKNGEEDNLPKLPSRQDRSKFITP